MNKTKVNDLESVKQVIKKCVQFRDKTHLEELINIFKTTTSYAVADTIAIAFADIGDKEAVPALVEVISRPEMHNHNGTLTYACWELGDLSEYLPFFSDLVINDTYETSQMAYSVIKNMKGPFKRTEIEKILNKIKVAPKPDTDHERVVPKLKLWLKRRI